MSEWIERARLRAMGTAALLVVSGAAMGILVDRLWLSPPPAQASSLTAEGMAARLGLSPTEEARLRGLLDSLHAEIVRQGPDSLGVTVRDAQRRIEETLPPDARSEFRAWMREHHERMMHRMHGGPRDHGGG